MKRFLAIVVYFVRTYPLSLLVVAGVLYLSLATLPQDAVPAVPNLDAYSGAMSASNSSLKKVKMMLDHL